jgi:hypothetical protein
VPPFWLITAALQSLTQACETQVASPKDLAERSIRLSPEDSQVPNAFVFQTAPNFAFFFVNWATGLTICWVKFRCVVITQDAIYALDSYRKSGGARPTSILGTLPRHTQLAPCRVDGVN